MRHVVSSVLVGSLVLVGCTRGSATPPPPRSVARPQPTPVPFRAPQGVAPSQAPRAHLPAQSGSIAWVPTLAEAQAQARASQRLLLVTTTKSDCGLCEKFMHQVAPSAGARLNEVAVCYVYDITRPESGRLDGALRANLPGAILMPLVGFFTPDLGWVHGFAGPRSTQEFMGDIETAARLQPRRNAQLRSVSGPAVAQVSFVNEFGETEWSAPQDAWPKPVDAIGAQPVLAQIPTPAPTATPAEPAPAIGPTVAVVDHGVVDPAVVDPAVVDRGAVGGWSEPPPALPVPPPVPVERVEPVAVALPPDPSPAAPPATVAGTVALPAPLPPAAAPLPSAIAPVAMTETDARTRLIRAFEAIRSGRYDEARDELRRVSRSLPNTQIGREADRGGAAVFNARRIAEAGETERQTLAAQARRSLGGTMWEPLF